MSHPSSGPNNKPSKKPALLATSFMLNSCLAYSSTLKMEPTYSSETLVDFQRAARRYVPEDRTLQFPSSTLKMEPTYSSETLVDFQRATRRYVPEDRTLQFPSLVTDSTDGRSVYPPLRSIVQG
jgi:hypothetical protein